MPFGVERDTLHAGPTASRNFLDSGALRSGTGYLFVALAVLVAVAGWRVRHRLRHQTRSGVTDKIVHQIETLGRVDAEDVSRWTWSECGPRRTSSGPKPGTNLKRNW